MKEKFNHYLEMSLRIRKLNLPKDHTSKERKEIKNIFNYVKQGLQELKNEKNELVFSGKVLDTSFNVHGSIKESSIDVLIEFFRNCELKYKEYDFDLDTAFIKKKVGFLSKEKISVFSVDVTSNKRLGLKNA